MKIKKNDIVKMLSGKDRGKTGKVLEVFPKTRKIAVEGLNLIKKHIRPKREGQPGQRIEIPRKVGVSSAALVCPKCQSSVRTGWKIREKGKFRVCKKCQAEV